MADWNLSLGRPWQIASAVGLLLALHPWKCRAVVVDTTNLTASLQTIVNHDPHLAYMTDVVAPPDQSGRLFATTLIGGEIRVLDSDLNQSHLYLSTRSDRTFQESLIGFNSMAFHPQFATPQTSGYGRFYTLETELPGIDRPADFVPRIEATPLYDQVLYEYTAADPAADTFLAAHPRRELLRITQVTLNHSANDLAFDAQGHLYISVGDGGTEFALRDRHPQFLDNPYGKILRIDPLGNNALNGNYGIPWDNPFGSTPGALPEVWAYGLRNPWRIYYDDATSRLFIGDVGVSSIEEINVAQGGENFGWNLREGSEATPLQDGGPPPPNAVEPRFQYRHSEGVAVIGGFVYRGTQFPQLYGKYIFGDYQGPHYHELAAKLFYVDPDDVTGTIYQFNLAPDSAPLLVLTSIAPDAHGEPVLVGGTVVQGAVRVTSLTLPEDFNGDGAVDALDAGMLFAHWGDDGFGDLTRDGIVDAADAGQMFQVWSGDSLHAVPEVHGMSILLGLACCLRRCQHHIGHEGRLPR